MINPTLVVVKVREGYTTISVGGKQRELHIDPREWNASIDRYNDGALIQDAFPTLSPEDREFMLTGLDEEAWDEIFGNDPE